MIDRERLIRWYDWQAPFYRLWRNRYDDPLLDLIAERLAACGPRRALDAACGTGFATMGLAARMPTTTLVGVDRSTGMLRVATRERGRLDAASVLLAAGDVTELPLRDGAVDAAVVVGLIPLLDDPLPALRELRRVVAPGGPLVSAEFDRERLTGRTGLIFRSMMAGHAVLARLFPSIRYADAWDVERSTIEPASYERRLRDAGWRIERLDRAHRHLIYVAVSPRPR